MYKAGCLLVAGLSVVAAQTAPSTPPKQCKLTVNATNTCFTCAAPAQPLCIPRTGDTLAINVVGTNDTKICTADQGCAFEVPRLSLQTLVCSDATNGTKTLKFKRAYVDGYLVWGITDTTLIGMTGLTRLEVNGNRPAGADGIDDPNKDYLEVRPKDNTRFPMSMTSIALKTNYVANLTLANYTGLTEVEISGSMMSSLPPMPLATMQSLIYWSKVLWDFPVEVLNMPKAYQIDLSNNVFSNTVFTKEQLATYSRLVNQSLLIAPSSLGNCVGFPAIQGCNNAPQNTGAANGGSSGPSSGAITTLVVVSCIASLLVLVAIVVHRRNRHHSDMSPGILNSNSPDDDFYGIDEAYVTNQTMSKYKTAGANDASLTKIPPEQVALARCLGGDIWMGEMGEKRIVLRRAPRFAGDHITDSFFQGVKEMARLSHPNLVTYMGVTCLSGTDIYAVAEFMDKGSLTLVYQTMPLTWEVQLGMATDVAEALHYLHTMMPTPVPVENLRSSNVLVSNTFSCKFNIFNFMASYKSHQMVKEMYGHNQLAWRAPEVLMNEMKNFLAADIYSMGVVLAEIGTCTRPFDREIGEVGTVHTDVWIVDSVMAGKGVPTPYDGKSPKWTNLPEDYQKLVKACLHATPSQRPNSGIILQRLKALKKDGIEL
ncbi:Aste57867_8112 [Aphanomyces stellatus]|uniref:Aste57867_8112 protein n=1 Tax=Aphanomyces stellatus TaxID=120398 RepID=A0A485KJD8_9STRA|nr:hypothetical protein As57867_008082 [Aphanomyces stellatus]VFT85001.1 Aste57867_8112 [Aphanomyces stellatus]